MLFLNCDVLSTTPTTSSSHRQHNVRTNRKEVNKYFHPNAHEKRKMIKEHPKLQKQVKKEIPE